MLTLSSATAQALTADDVLNKMGAEQSSAYLAGVIDGLATARWLADKPDATGMNCIYDWYYKQPSDRAWTQIVAWFERRQEQQAALLMHVLTKRECGV